MVDGRVRNLSGHLDRLTSAVPNARDYIDDIRARLRDCGDGEFMPWISVEDHTWAFEVRPVRPIATDIILDVHGHLDERRHPTIKGPDLGWQARALAASRRQGADDGLLIDDRGRAISAIESSIMAIQGELVFHSTHPRAMRSVTEDQVLEYLGLRGAELKPRPEGFDVEELRGSETWLLDSTHGVRRVAGWMEYGTVFPVPESRPVAGFIPAYSEVNDQLWGIAEEV